MYGIFISFFAPAIITASNIAFLCYNGNGVQINGLFFKKNLVKRQTRVIIGYLTQAEWFAEDKLPFSLFWFTWLCVRLNVWAWN